MSATINIGGVMATYTDGEWHCNDAAIRRRLLDVTTATYLPDGVIAMEAAAALEGTIVSITEEDDDPRAIH